MASVRRVKTVRYLLAGKQVPKSTPGAERVEELSRHYYGSGVPGWPAGKRVRLASDRAAAERALADLVRRAERGLAGLPDADAARERLANLVPAFEADVALGLAGKVRRAADPAQARLVAGRVAAALVSGCGLELAGDLASPAVAKLATLLRDKIRAPRAAGGWSHQTADFHLAACRRFCRWLARRGAPVAADLFDQIPGADPKNHRAHARRAATPDELARLLAAASAGAPNRGLTGPERHTLYLVAFSTGFRASELSRLTAGCFYGLGTDAPSVTLPGKDAKSRKAARGHPLPAGVGRHLAAHLAGKPPGGRAFPPGTWAAESAKRLRVDLRSAGVAYALDGPEGAAYLDFHALRHSFVSALAEAGVGPRELQLLARHSTSALTTEVYTHVRAPKLAEAVERIALPGAGSESVTPAQLAALFELLVVAFAARHPG